MRRSHASPSMWRFRHLGNANSPALYPSTLQKKGPLWEAMCSHMVFTNLNTLEHVGQVSCSTIGGGPCLALRCATSTCLVEYPLLHSWHQCPFSLPQLFWWRSNMAPEANTFPHWSQDHPVSPVWVFMWWCSDLVLLKHWKHSSQLVSPACTSGTSKGTSSHVAPEAHTFLPASISFKIPWAFFRSFLGTFMKPSSTSGAGGAGSSGGEGSDGGGLLSLLDTPRMSSISSASSLELTPTASRSSVSSG